MCLLLQAVEQEETFRSGAFHEPLTELETLLKELWASVLGQEATTFRLDTDFFRAGGDSIGAMKLSALARKHDMELTVKSILQHPELSEMALKMKSMSISMVMQAPYSLIHPSEVDSILETAAAMCNVPEAFIQDIYPCTPLQIELFVF